MQYILIPNAARLHKNLNRLNKGIISEKDELVARLITESNELISIFVKSINTALKKSS